jgi:hypothetical protein
MPGLGISKTIRVLTGRAEYLETRVVALKAAGLRFGYEREESNALHYAVRYLTELREARTVLAEPEDFSQCYLQVVESKSTVNHAGLGKVKLQHDSMAEPF